MKIIKALQLQSEDFEKAKRKIVSYNPVHGLWI